VRVFWYGNNKGKTQFGRTKIRLVNNIKTELKVTGIEERERKDLPQNWQM